MKDELVRVRVIVPGFGAPNLEKKIDIFKNNLDILVKTRPENCTLHIHVHIYDDSETPIPMLSSHGNTSWGSITYHRGAGIVGQFIATHSTVLECECDKVFIVLDDVELMPSFHLGEAIRVQEACFLDILSPTLTNQSPTFYNYMKSSYGPIYSKLPNSSKPVPLVRITSACELFCYLMNANSFIAWCMHLDPANPWIWGMDLLLTHKFGLRVGMLPHMTVHHHFQNASYDAHPEINPFQQLQAYLAKYGESQESLSHMAAIITTIIQP